MQLSKHCLQELIDVPLLIDILSSRGFIDDELREELHTTQDEQLKKEYIIHFLSCFEESQLTEMLNCLRQRKEMKTAVDEIEKWRCLGLNNFSVFSLKHSRWSNKCITKILIFT